KHGRGLLAFAARQGLDVAVLRISIDKFDLLEKKKGKAVAEKVLLSISKIINASVRAEDSVARVEKAKFAVMMPGANEAGAKVLAGRIHRLIGNAVYKLGKTRFRMTASAGLVYQAKDQSIPFEKIVELAEARLNTAIRKGGNNLVLEGIEVQETQQDSGPIQRPITLDEALALLSVGQTNGLREHLGGLLTKIYPLLEYSNKELHLEMAPALKVLGRFLKQTP
ncbi:MAG: diguanylate cyclase, partial [Pseudomonadota bacterium]